LTIAANAQNEWTGGKRADARGEVTGARAFGGGAFGVGVIGVGMIGQ
jgi:hypothetical protein